MFIRYIDSHRKCYPSKLSGILKSVKKNAALNSTLLKSVVSLDFNIFAFSANQFINMYVHIEKYMYDRTILQISNYALMDR